MEIINPGEASVFTPSYGGFSATSPESVETTTIATVNTPVPITKPVTAGSLSGITMPADNDLVVSGAGDYVITGGIAGRSSTGSVNFQLWVYVDGVETQALARYLVGTASETVPLNSAPIALTAGQKVEIWVENVTNAAEFNVLNFNLSLTKVS